MKRDKNTPTNIYSKILAYNKEGNKRSLKFLGLTLYEKDSNESYKTQKFLGGVVRTKNIRSIMSEKKYFEFLKIPFCVRTIENSDVTYRIFGLLIKHVELANVFYKKYLKNINIKFDDVYILSANSGEIFLFCAYCLKPLLKKNHSKNPLFMACRKYHEDILKLFYPEAHCILIDKPFLKTKKHSWKILKHNFYLIFPSNYFYEFTNDICKLGINETHYLNNMAQVLGLSDKEYSKPNPIITKEVEESLFQKIGFLNLNLENFIIIAPEAQTCKLLPRKFWEILIKKIQENNIDVFLNVIDITNYIDKCKTTFLNYREIFLLSQKAKAVISLRSGFSEVLTPIKIPNITINTEFQKLDNLLFPIEKTMAAYSINKLPFVENSLISEINANNFPNVEELVNNVLLEYEHKIREVQKI